MVTDVVLAAVTVALVATRPRSWRAAVIAGGVATVSLLAVGFASLGAALQAVWPMLCFLTVALAAASAALRLGLIARAASVLARLARGRTAALYWLLCALCALLTATLSLDGAIVLATPLAVELSRRLGVARRPLVLGVVAVANAFSLALPEGNPTNLVVLDRLGVSLGEAATRLVLPGVAATALSAALVAWRERRSLSGRYGQRKAAGARQAPSVDVGAVARIGLQLVALLVVCLPLAPSGLGAGADLGSLLAVALLAALAAALVNNLPASALVAASVAPGAPALAALVGLSVGALATPHGSVATLIAADLADERAHAKALALAAAGGVVLATLLLWARLPA